METRNRILERVERLLPMFEDLLRGLVGAAPEPGFFDRALAFRWDRQRGPGRFEAIENPAPFELDDLLGVDEAIASLVANTEQFLAGHPYNHVLLYGERGTGKSSALRGLLTRYGDRGLRVVEILKEDLAELPRVLAALARAREQRFIVFCDDLSFGAGESGFREVKAAIDGRLEAPPSNVCLLATSNRRHLLPESMEENREARTDEAGELHLGEASEEKLALSDRFGLVLGFHGFDQATYLAIVQHYLERAEVDLAPDAVREEALAWALRRASRSGRTARQFVTDLVGRHQLALDRAQEGPGTGSGA
ncbi:MAG: ATP-binding protein [Myxococcota bacterium]